MQKFEAKLLVEKVIYAKRKPVTYDEMKSIMEIEIGYHLRQHPELVFKGFGKIKDNDDRSKTFPLIFMYNAAAT